VSDDRGARKRRLWQRRPPPSPELQARFARRLHAAVGVAYAAEVAPGLLRGGQPNEAGVAWLRGLGVRTVVNLRNFHGSRERTQILGAGLRYERIALASTDPPAPKDVERFLSIVRDPAARPVYVHCLHGVDRTGAMLAVYRMEVDGWTNAEAFAEMVHFDTHRILRDLRNFVKRYVPGTLRTGKVKRAS
jgi:protein tyrosine/serine phosphatase